MVLRACTTPAIAIPAPPVSLATVVLVSTRVPDCRLISGPEPALVFPLTVVLIRVSVPPDWATAPPLPPPPLVSLPLTVVSRSVALPPTL
jgi:hypothetical protein